MLETLRRHESALVYDFRSVHNLRLADAVVSYDHDELFDLIIWLPPGSAFRSSIEADGDEEARVRIHGWTPLHDLLVAVANIGLRQAYILEAVHSKKPPKPPVPLVGPRDETRKKRGTGDASAHARMLLATQGG